MTSSRGAWSHACAGCGHWLAAWIATCTKCGRPQEGVQASAPEPTAAAESEPMAAPEPPGAIGSAESAPPTPAADGLVVSETPVSGSPASASEAFAQRADAHRAAGERVYCPFCGKHVPATADRCPRCRPAEPAASGDRVRHGGRCPRCAASLTTVDRDGIAAEACARCGGTWLDRDQVARALPLVTRGTGRPSAPLPRRANSDPIVYLLCVRCHQQMARRLLAPRCDVIVDLCPEHGIWFDRGEIEHLSAFLAAGGLELARARDDARERDEVRHAASGDWLDVDASGGIGQQTLRALDRVIRDNGQGPYGQRWVP
jgi:Zn-finger nucleic acid-binding protein